MENREFPTRIVGLHALPGNYKFGAHFEVPDVEKPPILPRSPVAPSDPLQRLDRRPPFILLDPVLELRKDG